jgi:hypothetical protein
MKHSPLAMLLFLGIGLTSGLSLLGGGNNYLHGMGDPDAQEATGASTETGAKGNTGGTGQRQAVIHDRAGSANARQNTTPGHVTYPAQ